MSLAHAMWIHGHSLRVENPDTLESARRHGSAITLIGRANTDNWFHMAIPTPVIVDDKGLHLDSVMLRFRTSGATITAVHVYDGETKIENRNGLSLNSDDYCFERIPVGGTPHIRWGLGVSFKGQFGGPRLQRRIDVSSAGGDFFNP
jgi:hypothetical protein